MPCIMLSNYDIFSLQWDTIISYDIFSLQCMYPYYCNLEKARNGQQVGNHVCILDFAIQRMKIKQFYGEWFSLDSLKYAIFSKTCYINALSVSTTCTMNMTSKGYSIITISSRNLKFSLDGLFGILNHSNFYQAKKFKYVAYGVQVVLSP